MSSRARMGGALVLLYACAGCGIVTLCDIVGGDWPADSTVDVSIEPDPQGLGRDELIRQGIERWTNRLAEKGIGLRVWIDADELESNVSYYWGPFFGFEYVWSGYAWADCDWAGTIHGGRVYLFNGVDAQYPESIRNLGEHELIHILGIPDTFQGSVMRSFVDDSFTRWSEVDQAVWEEHYPCPVAVKRAAWVGESITIDPAPAASNYGLRVATDEKGTWVAAWAAKPNPPRDELLPQYDVKVSRSEDLGRTWSDPSILAQGDLPCTSLAADGQGNWLLAWGSEGLAGDEPTVNMSVSVSRDNAVTWSTPQCLSESGSTCVQAEVMPGMVSDRQGGWGMAWGENGEIVFARSNDGLAWQRVSVISRAPADGVGPRLAASGTGTWVASWTGWDDQPDQSASDALFVSRSADDGLTWSDPVIVASPLRGDGPTFDVRISTDGVGNWGMVSIADQDCGSSRCETITDAIFRRSTDDGLTWSDPRVLETLNGIDSVDIVPDGHGQWLVSYVGTDVSQFSYAPRVRLVVGSDDGDAWGLPESIGAFNGDGRAARLATDGWGNWLSVRLGGQDDPPRATLFQVSTQLDDSGCRQ